MELHLKLSDSDVNLQLSDVWESGLCSLRYTKDVYDAVMNIILTAFDYIPKPIMDDVRRAVNRPKELKAVGR